LKATERPIAREKCHFPALRVRCENEAGATTYSFGFGGVGLRLREARRFQHSTEGKLMRLMRFVPLLFGLSLLSLPASVAAQAPSAKPPAPGAHPAHPVAKERLEEAKERAKERRDEAKERRDEAKEKREDRRDEAKERREEKREDADERREKRQERRRAHVEDLRKRWGDSLVHPALRAELKVHARRIARLNHMRRLAEKAEKPKVVERIDKLIEKENARHQKHMDTLKSQAAGEGGAK